MNLFVVVYFCFPVQHRTSAPIVCVGEDAKLKQMLWVVENLQEELFRSQEYRLQAEKHQHHDRATIESLQVLVASLGSTTQVHV